MLAITNLVLLVVIAYVLFIQRQQIKRLLEISSDKQKTDSQNDESADKSAIKRHNSIAAELTKLGDKQNELGAQVEALVLALKRTTSIEDLAWIYARYQPLQQLLYLRRKGIPEETIAFEHMQYKEPSMLSGGGQGFTFPKKNPETGECFVTKIAPYYVAVNGIDFNEVGRLSKEREEELACGTWSRHFEPEGTQEVVWGVWLTNSDGDFMYYPTREIQKKRPI